MIQIERRRNRLSFLLKPLCIALLLFALFGLVWLKSNVISLEYNISSLEKKKEECLKERKILFAEKANLQSFETINSSLSGDYVFVFPNRIKVIHVKRQKGPLPYKVSLEKKQVGLP
jgi:cell division protein FtsB